MNWKIPLNHIGSGRSFAYGSADQPAKFKDSPFTLDQHPWLADILAELSCMPEASETSSQNFSFLLDIEKQSDCFRVMAHLKMNPKLECVRSLTEFRHAVEVTSEAIFVRAPDDSKQSEHELSESEMEAYEHDGNGLVVSEFLTDLIYTSLPDFPLCQPECKGLCSVCGCNLNQVSSCAASANRQSNSGFECPSVGFFN